MMNMFDEARTISGMIEMLGMTQNEVAKRLGTSQSYVGNKVRLLNLSPKIQEKILEKGLSERHARALLRLEDDKTIEECIEKIAGMKMTVQECEALVDVYVEAKVPRLIGNFQKRERIDHFDRFLTESINSLKSYGIDAKKENGYYGDKRYIMISIEQL